MKAHLSAAPPARVAGIVLISALVFLLAGVAAPRPAAGAPNDHAKIAVHLLGVTAKNACARSAASPACAGIVTAGGLFPQTYFAYLLVTDADATAGLLGVQCGLSYNGAAHAGVDVYSWNLCASLEFPSGGWPGSGGGNLITWNSDNRCQRNEPGGPGTGVVAPAGYLYMAAYSSDVLQVTPRPVDGQARVADCSNVESIIAGGGVNAVPSPLGAASFSPGGAAGGYNPCGPNAGVDCTIAGPDVVVAGAGGLVYSTPLVPAGASHDWSVSGNGTIVGSTTGATVTLLAGAGGSFSLNVSVTSAGQTTLCSKLVTVGAPPPTCSITGPTSVNSRTAGLTFDVSSNVTAPTIDWTVSGNGTITAGAHSARVTVTSGEAGAFELTATLHSPDSPFPGECHYNVTVVEPVPSCLITGPSIVLSGQAGIAYGVDPSIGELTSVSWSISGNGTITSAANQPGVVVQAGSVGTFNLTATIHTNASILPAICSRTISVMASIPTSCSISGATTVPANVQGFQYTVSANQPITSVAWSISGNGTLTSDPHNLTVRVTSGEIGAFELTAVITSPNTTGTTTCLKTVTVVESAPVCAIDGLAEVTAGTQGLGYAVDSSVSYTVVLWTISGHGVITSDPHLPTVTVEATDVGAFTLTAALTTPGGLVQSCSRTITVIPFPCVIQGPAEVAPQTANVPYSVDVPLSGATYLWSTVGPAYIHGSATGPSVLVDVYTAATFTIAVSITRNGITRSCSRAITITPRRANGQPNAKLAIHLTPTITGNACGSRGEPTCGQIETRGRLLPNSYFAYLLVVAAGSNNGVGGLQCGITYNAVPQAGVDVFGWTLCASLEFSSAGPNGPWPAAGSGNLITWETATRCQRGEPGGPGTGVVAAAGYFYCGAYSPDILRLVPRPVDNQAKVADCFAQESVIGGTGFPAGNPSQLGFAQFSASGGAPGYNPCGVATPVRVTTWSAIKGLYR